MIELQVTCRVTKATIAVTIPQNTIVPIADNERNTYLCVILEKVFVLAFHIEFLRLMLSQTVESLIIRTVKQSMPTDTLKLFSCQMAV